MQLLFTICSRSTLWRVLQFSEMLPGFSFTSFSSPFSLNSCTDTMSAIHCVQGIPSSMVSRGEYPPVAFFPCPDRSLGFPPSASPTLLVPLGRSHPFRLNACLPSCRGVSAPCARPCHAMAYYTSPCPPFSAIGPGPQRLGCCKQWLYQPHQQTRHRQGLGHGKCSAPNQRCYPSSVCFNAQGLNFPCIYVDLHNRATKPDRVSIYRRHRCIGHC